ncbi:UDP-galactose transporter senju [Oratosquilla oratoria]|uniref:UDP-galactose transporter senju n=1 Tax=Oratosquilla oratoria TaxID=337810 RepID=UPI003F766DDF
MEVLNKCSDLFPTKTSFIIFILYMALFINQGIVVTASQRADSSYGYNTVTVVLLTEATKLVVSLLAYLKWHSFSSLCLAVRIHAKDIPPHVDICNQQQQCRLHK